MNATQAQMIMYSKLFKINFTKMDPYEFKTFTDILQRYCCQEAIFIEGSQLTKFCLSRNPYKIGVQQGVQITSKVPQFLDF